MVGMDETTPHRSPTREALAAQRQRPPQIRYILALFHPAKFETMAFFSTGIPPIPSKGSKPRRRLYPQAWLTPSGAPSESESSSRQAFHRRGISRFAGRSCAALHGPV